MLDEVEILDEITLYRSGSFKRVRRYLRGIHKDRGQIIRGHTGWETVEETDVLVPMGVYTVTEHETTVVPFPQHDPRQAETSLGLVAAVG